MRNVNFCVVSWLIALCNLRKRPNRKKCGTFVTDKLKHKLCKEDYYRFKASGFSFIPCHAQYTIFMNEIFRYTILLFQPAKYEYGNFNMIGRHSSIDYSVFFLYIDYCNFLQNNNTLRWTYYLFFWACDVRLNFSCVWSIFGIFPPKNYSSF